MNGGNNSQPQPQDNETGGFSFAVMAITAFVGFSYYLSNYFQTKSADPLFYGYVSLIMPILMISSIALIFYVFLKGFAMGLPLEHELKKAVDKWALKIYVLSFVTTIVTLILIASLIFVIIKPESSYYISIFFFVIISVWSIKNLSNGIANFFSSIKTKIFTSSPGQSQSFIQKHKKPILSIILLISVIFIISILLNYINPLDIFLISIEIIVVSIFFVGNLIYSKIYIGQYSSIIIGLFILIFLVLFSPFVSIYSNFFIQGDVKIDMENTYNKSDNPIPVSIQLTGSNTELYIKLYNESSNHSLTEIDNITLNPKNTNNINFSKYLRGNSLQNGNSNVYISTIQLSKGDYKLEVTTLKPNRNDTRMFYLLDNS